MERLMPMKTKTAILLISFCICLRAIGNDYAIPIIEGILEDRSSDLFLKSTEHGFPCFIDLDGDGDSDLLLGGYESVRYYRNDGTQKAPKWTIVTMNLFEMPINSAFHALDPCPADMDGDGDADFIIGCNAGYIYYYLNNGNLNFTQMTSSYVPGISGNNLSVTAGDINGDGLFDLLVGVRQGTTGVLYYCENTGTRYTALFAEPQLLNLDLEGQCFPIPELVDMDADGDLDLLVSTARWPDYVTKIFYFRNDGTRINPSFTKITNDYFALQDNCWARMGFFDYEQDGDQDCLLFDGNLGYYGFMKNEGSAIHPVWRFTRDVFQLFSYLGVNSICALGDLDGDGDQDMLQTGGLRDYTWLIGYYENRGTPANPNWSYRTNNYVDTGNLGRWPALCDIDQDGDLDLFLGGHISYGSPGIVFYRNDGDSFSPNWTHITNTYMGITVSEQAFPCFGDMDGDGLPDLLLGYKHSSIPPKVRFYRNNGSAGNPLFNSYVDIVEPVYPGSIVWSQCYPALGDVDADGDLDLFVATDCSPGDFSGQKGQINFFRNVGSATNPLFILETAKWQDLDFKNILHISIGDPDGDGLPNLFVSDRDLGLEQYACRMELLSVTPSLATLTSGEDIEFQASGFSGDLSARILENRSGGSIDGLRYTAGETTGVIDKIRIEDSNSSRFRNAYINVISPDDIGRAGKAVIVAGWKGAGDPLWPDTARSTTNYLANFAYRTLLHRGFSKENIYYLSPDPAQDVDGDGANNDVDAESTLLNVQYALSDWAGQAPAPAKLLVYLVDHGGEQGAGQGYLRLNPGEVLLAQTVDAWLDALQVTHPGLEVTLAVDACRSGSFLDECLAPTGLDRVTLASAMDSQDAFFSAGGAISFSEAFFNSIYTGLSVGQSFTNAAGAMDRYQTAWLDDTGDGLWAKDEDGAAADARIIGATFIAGADRPQIGKINANQSIASGTSALLWAADVASV